MKKPIIVLIIFFVTISAFAEDKPSYIKNFSLVKVSDANNRVFFDFTVFFLSDHLNYTEKNSNSSQYQTFPIPELQHYSEQNNILEVKAFIDREKNSGDIYGLRFGQQKEIRSEQTKSSLAEEYLKRLARISKKNRQVGGTVILIVGGISVAVGSALISRDEEDYFGWNDFWGNIIIVEGVAYICGGVIALVVPSAAEKKLDDVLGVSDPGRRERASEEALASLARKGRRSRILSGTSLAVVSALSLGSYVSVICGPIAVYQFLRKSQPERFYQNYLKEKERQNELELRIGIGPYAGARVSLYLPF